MTPSGYATWRRWIAQPGRLVVGISRSGNLPGVDVPGIDTLIHVTLRVLHPGAGPVTFSNATLLDSRALPQPVPDVSWFGGTLSAN